MYLLPLSWYIGAQTGKVEGKIIGIAISVLFSLALSAVLLVAGVVFIAGIGTLYVAYLILRFLFRNLWRLIKYCYHRYRLHQERKYGIVSDY